MAVEASDKEGLVSLQINGLLALELRLLMTWSGVWAADIIMKDATVPSGKVVITSTDGLSFVGTVDPERTGIFGEKQHVRVIGGGGGWGKNVRAQHFHSDIGVTLQALAGATAAEAGELVNVLAPVALPVDFVRQNKTAAQIFQDVGVDWWVDVNGVTQVGSRVPKTAPLTLQVNDWDPSAGTVNFVSSDLVQPGMIVVDTRFGTKFVTEVDATIRDGAIHGTLRLASTPPTPGSLNSELLDSLAALATHHTAVEYARLYEYRVISMAGTRVNVQAVHKSDGMPDLLPISIWGGISGYKATLTPSSRVLVGFTSEKQPYVAAYEPPDGGGWRPLTLELDATGAVLIGGQSLAVTLGSPIGALPVARAPAIEAYAAAVESAFSAMAAAALATTITPVTGAGLAAFLGPVVAALTAANAALGVACPSLKVVSS
jgi:hypothetical protein